MLIYKICPKGLWTQALQAGVFDGAPVDHADGYHPFLDRRAGAGNGGEAFCRPGRPAARCRLR